MCEAFETPDVSYTCETSGLMTYKAQSYSTPETYETVNSPENCEKHDTRETLKNYETCEAFKIPKTHEAWETWET